MATLFSELVGELTGIVPGYSSFLCSRDLKKSYRDILNRRTWSFLLKEGAFNAPALISSGTVSVTQNSEIVTADATAAAAFDAVGAATPTLIERQFRISSAGAIYNIVSWDTSTNALELDRPILEPTAAAASYMVYQCYFPPPPEALQSDGTYDFNLWLSVIDPVQGIPLTQDKGKPWLDRRDPQRSCFDLAYRIFDYKKDALGNPFYEFWPHPTQGQEYVCLYRAKGLNFTSGTDPLPDAIPDSLLSERCLNYYAYPWAAVNAGRNPDLRRTNWQYLMVLGRKQWEFDLQQAKLQDENTYMQAIVGSRRNGWPFPVDANFLQNHSTGLEPFI